jgi:hypothetical protein
MLSKWWSGNFRCWYCWTFWFLRQLLRLSVFRIKEWTFVMNMWPEQIVLKIFAWVEHALTMGGVEDTLSVLLFLSLWPVGQHSLSSKDWCSSVISNTLTASLELHSPSGFTCFVCNKQVGHQADCSPPSSTEVKKAQSYICISPYVCVAWCLVMCRNNFNLSLPVCSVYCIIRMVEMICSKCSMKVAVALCLSTKPWRNIGGVEVKLHMF